MTTNDSWSNLSSIDSADSIARNPFLYTPFLIAICFTTIIGTAGNILQISAIIHSNELQNPGHLLVANSAVGDALIAVFSNGLTLIGLYHGEVFYQQQPVLCQMTAATNFGACTGTLFTLMTISINRYIKVCRPQLYERIFTPRKTVAICVAIWLLTVITVALPLVNFGRYAFDRKACTCMIDRTYSLSFSVLASFSVIFIPGFTSAFCYTRIFVYIRRSRRLNKDEQRTSNIIRRGGNSLTKTLFVITVSYFLFLSPAGVLFIVDHWDTLPQWPFMYALALAYSKTAVDPILFCVTNKSYRKGYISVLGLNRFIKTTHSEWTTENQAATYQPSTTTPLTDEDRVAVAVDYRATNNHQLNPMSPVVPDIIPQPFPK